MSRIGIIIAVSNNIAPVKSLAACANDGAAIAALLKETGRFDDLLILSSEKETASKHVKAELSAFVDKHKSTNVEELFYYFSGHGDFSSNEFYHILSDYKKDLRNQTTLTSGELDTMMRALSPDLFVKVVDACYSGVTYIKGGDEELGEYLKSTTSNFKSVYFLYSSQNSEQSLTAGKLSAFTTGILEAVAAQDSGPIRYRDLMSAASDYFELHGTQTPQFVTQAPFTEVFCEASPALRAALKQYLPPTPKPPVPAAPPLPTPAASSGPSPAPVKSITLLERIKSGDEAYVSREEALAALKTLQTHLSAVSLPADLRDIFDLKIIPLSEKPSDASVIGEWIATNAERNYYAAASHKTETYKRRVPKSPPSVFNFSSRLFQRLADEDTKLIDATRSVISGYNNTASLPFSALTIRLEPKFKVVAPEECTIAPIVSATSICAFWTMRHFYYSDWDTAVPKSNSRWVSAELSLKRTEEFSKLADRIGAEFFGFVERHLTNSWSEEKSIMPINTNKAK